MKTFLQDTRRLSALLFLCPLILAWQGYSEGNANNSAIYVDADSYQIYAVLLQTEKQSLYVVQEEINSYPGRTAKNIGIKGDSDFMRLWGTVMDDYAKQNRIARQLARNIPINTPYELIPESSIFPREHGQSGWDDFYRRFPASRGYYWFSAVGFNSKRTRAIVDMGYLCGLLCGGGRPHFFEKKGTKWVEVSVNADVMVWAS